MAISDITGESNFDFEPPTYHWIFIAFIITYVFIPINWIIPVPGLCFINLLVSGTLLIIFFVLYGLEFSDNMDQYTTNLLFNIADKFGINLQSIYNDAIAMRDSTDLTDDSDTGLFSSNSAFMKILNGEQKLFDADPVGFDDYATVKIETISSN